MNRFQNKGVSHIVALLALILIVLPATVFADSRLDTGPLPVTLVEREDCFLTEVYPWGGYGWDGEKTCIVTDLRLVGVEHTVTGIQGDYRSLPWSNDFVAI